MTRPGRGPTALACAAALALARCGDSSEPPVEALFRVRACRGSAPAPAGETFTVLVRDPAAIREFDGLTGQGNQRIVTGPFRLGDGGFNQPWSWHLDPDSVALAEMAIEACDGCPSIVEANRQDYLQVGRYCPWTSEVEARIR